MYMNKKEVVDALSHHSRIEPCITELGNAHCSFSPLPLVQPDDSFLLLASRSEVNSYTDLILPLVQCYICDSVL